VNTFSDAGQTWSVADIWLASEALPVEEVSLASLDAEALLDSTSWSVDGGEAVPLTCREILGHAQRLEDADLSYPVILTPDGVIADGCHRILKAQRLGNQTIRVVRLREMPTPLTT